MSKQALPEIEFNAQPESTQIMFGESATLSWKVKGAEKAYILQVPATMSGVLPIDWHRLGQKGQEVESAGQMVVSPITTTTYIVAAVGKEGRKARSVILEVWKEKPRRGKAYSWHQGLGIPPRDWGIDPDPLLDEDFIRWWRDCDAQGAAITFSANPQVVFVDEETTLTWEITCSECAMMNSGGDKTILIEDLTRPSGTRVVSGSSFRGEPLACSLPMSGEATSPAFDGPGRQYWYIFAEGIGTWGSAGGATAQVMYLPYPSYNGCNAERQAEIEDALKEICRRLLDGCIRDDAVLDREVAAFRDGHLDRLAVWRRLLVELENINLTTFRCIDDASEIGRRAGSWTDYSNEVRLYWQPEPAGTWLPEIILHELIHKSGFHGALIEHYADPNEIETQTRQVTASCF